MNNLEQGPQPNQNKQVGLVSLLKASHRLRDLSLVARAYVLCRNGIFVSGNLQTQATLAILFDAKHKLYKMDVVLVSN